MKELVTAILIAGATGNVLADGFTQKVLEQAGVTRAAANEYSQTRHNVTDEPLYQVINNSRGLDSQLINQDDMMAGKDEPLQKVVFGKAS